MSITQVSSRAKASSATFYEQFEGKEDCLLAAYRAVAERMFEEMRPMEQDGETGQTPSTPRSRGYWGR